MLRKTEDKIILIIHTLWQFVLQYRRYKLHIVLFYYLCDVNELIIAHQLILVMHDKFHMWCLSPSTPFLACVQSMRVLPRKILSLLLNNRIGQS